MNAARNEHRDIWAQVCTLFENSSKCRIWIFEFWHFPPIFILLKVTSLVTLFDRKLQVFTNSPKWTIFSILMNFCPLSPLEWDFFCDFQTPCLGFDIYLWWHVWLWSLRILHLRNRRSLPCLFDLQLWLSIVRWLIPHETQPNWKKIQEDILIASNVVVC